MVSRLPMFLGESESTTSSNHSEEHDQSVVVIKDDIDLEKQDDITVKAESGGAYEVSAVSEAASQNDDAVLEHFPDSDGNSEIGFGQIHQEPSDVIQQCSRKDPLPLELSLKFPALINTNRSVKSPTMRDPVRNASFSMRKNDIKLGRRDDDKKLFRYNKLNNKFKAYRFTRIGDRRIRKLLSSKYWKTAPTLKDYEFSKADVGRKPFYRKRKTCYGLERDQREFLYKRKKFSDGAFSSESVSNSPLKGSTVGKCFSAAVLHKGITIFKWQQKLQAMKHPYTRKIIMFDECIIPVDELADADEVFCTGTADGGAMLVLCYVCSLLMARLLFNNATTRSVYFVNRQLNDSIQVDLGETTMIVAERILLKRALEDLFNDRFVIVSDR
ncbi:hypothetical protein ACFE04_016473 [Oxalis oulophora]